MAWRVIEALVNKLLTLKTKVGEKHISRPLFVWLMFKSSGAVGVNFFYERECLGFDERDTCWSKIPVISSLPLWIG